MNLILWRHAEAEDLAPDHSDAGRRLTERGRKQAHKMATWLADNLPADAKIVTSPAVRTRQTADALGRPYDIDDRLFTDAGVEDYLAAADWSDRQKTRVLVGHQPTLGLLASLLMCGRPLPWSLKKGAVWWLAFESHDMPARLVCVLDSKHI